MALSSQVSGPEPRIDPPAFDASAGPTANATATDSAPPEPPRPVDTSRWPDTSSTGPTTEPTERVDGIETERDGQVIEDVIVEGTIKVEHDDVHVRDVVVEGRGEFGIYVPASRSDDVRGLVIEDTRIQGRDGPRLAGIAQYGGWTARRVDISGYQDGVKMCCGQVLEDSWIHDLRRTDDSHNDGVQSVGGVGSVIRGNRIEAPDDQTSAILLQANFGPIRDWVVEGNLLSGGGYSLYLTEKSEEHGPPRDVRVVDNVWMRDSWSHGPLRVDAGPGLEWSGNVYDDGEPVKP